MESIRLHAFMVWLEKFWRLSLLSLFSCSVQRQIEHIQRCTQHWNWLWILLFIAFFPNAIDILLRALRDGLNEILDRFYREIQTEKMRNELSICSSRQFDSDGLEAQCIGDTASGKRLDCFRLRSGSICHLTNIYDQFITHYDFTPPTNVFDFPSSFSYPFQTWFSIPFLFSFGGKKCVWHIQSK